MLAARAFLYDPFAGWLGRYTPTWISTCRIELVPKSNVCSAKRFSTKWRIRSHRRSAATLARLQREGMSEDEAIRWISAALLQEMSIMMREQRVYDHASYVAALDRLPGLIDR
jgi:hypothetical protein